VYPSGTSALPTLNGTMMKVAFPIRWTAIESAVGLSFPPLADRIRTLVDNLNVLGIGHDLTPG
jgi:DNA-binding Lrp family transcriptional regulator